jgi:hypothetical protein
VYRSGGVVVKGRAGRLRSASPVANRIMKRDFSGLARTAALIAVAAVLAVPFGALAATDSAQPCRPEFVVPYTDQCTFAYRAIGGDHSPASLQNAFTTCDRAQTVSVACVKSSTRQIHVIALNALYTDVSAQAEVAMYAGQYAVAETIFREKLSVLDAIGQEARPGDKGLQAARASTEPLGAPCRPSRTSRIR